MGRMAATPDTRPPVCRGCLAICHLATVAVVCLLLLLVVVDRCRLDRGIPDHGTRQSGCETYWEAHPDGCGACPLWPVAG